jgi:hypothetical protein
VQDAHESQSAGSVVAIQVSTKQKNDDGISIFSSLIVLILFQGLTPTGYLYAIGEDGRSYELHPDGNRYCSLIPFSLFVTENFMPCSVYISSSQPIYVLNM